LQKLRAVKGCEPSLHAIEEEEGTVKVCAVGGLVQPQRRVDGGFLCDGRVGRGVAAAAIVRTSQRPAAFDICNRASAGGTECPDADGEDRRDHRAGQH